MDRLISLNAVIKLIDELGYTNCRDSRDYEANNRMDKVRLKIQELPAAFDKEKVIEELKGEIELRVTHPLYPGRYIKKSRAIEIIEKGGI